MRVILRSVSRVPHRRGSRRTVTRTPDDHCTPGWILDVVRRVAPIGLDPCDNKWSTTAPKWSISSPSNGLSVDWKIAKDHLVWVNPPYSRGQALPWVRKCALEYSERNAHVMLLLPSDTSTAAYHEALSTCTAFYPLKKRVKFIGPEGRLIDAGRGHTIFEWRKVGKPQSTPMAEIATPCGRMGFTSARLVASAAGFPRSL